jgi:hypothetical protein
MSPEFSNQRDLLTPALFTPATGFGHWDRIVSTTVFHWFTPTQGNLSGAWVPLGGRKTWTGEASWWMAQIKQMMMAHIDVIYVHLIERFEEQRVNLFVALSELRRKGYDVPKIAPFLDPFGIWPPMRIDVSTKEGKDEVVRHYVRFFNQYFSVNTDAHAASFLARIENRVVLGSWWVYSILEKLEAFHKNDIEERLRVTFDARTPIFQNGIYIVSTALVDPDLSFSDERAVFFSGYAYCVLSVHRGVHVYHVQAGYWDQNIRQPGYHLPRHGGAQYKAAWDYILYQCSPVHRVYIESWNEYDESSGIYAADPKVVNKLESNRSMVGDCWSNAGDPFEYIRTTARSVSVLKSIPEWDSLVLEFPREIECQSQEILTLRSTFRNTGSKQWTSEDLPRPRFLANEAFFDLAAAVVEASPDVQDMDTFGGVFRGAPVSYRLSFRAPSQSRRYELTLRLHSASGEAFGQAATVRLHVK